MIKWFRHLIREGYYGDIVIWLIIYSLVIYGVAELL